MALRRLLTTTFALVLASAAVVVASPRAAAAEEDTRVYEGRYGSNWTTYTARCTGDTCLLTADDPPAFLSEFLGAPLTVTGGTARQELPDECGQADDGASHRRVLTLALTATDLTATVVEDGGERRVNGSICWARGSTNTASAQVVANAEATPEPSPAASAPGGQGPPAAAPVGGGSSAVTSSRLASGESDAPSVLSALRTGDDIDVRGSLLAALLTVVLVLLVAFPTALLNSAAEQGTDRFSAWWRRHRSAPVDPSHGTRRSRWWWAAGGVLAAGVVSSFVDPQFGLNPGSLRTLLSILVGFAVDVVLGWFVVIWLIRRSAPQATASYSFQPLSLLLVAAAVVFTRLSGFEPGIIFGLVAGIGFTALVGRAAEARATLTPMAYGAVVSLLAWAGYHLVDDATGTAGVFVAETLSATAVAGLSALPLVLFPVAGMPGARVFAWSRRVWAACYAFGLFAFFVVLLPTPYAWDEVGWSLKGWVLMYLGYLAVALATWAVLRRGRADGPTGRPQSRAAASRA